MAEHPVITIKPFSELALLELHACLKLRGEVFVVDQGICAVADVDERDPECHHVMMRLGDELVGTARLLLSYRDHAGCRVYGTGRGPHCVKVGRVAVAEAHRGKGYGTAMMRQIQAWTQEHPRCTGEMSAQAHLQDWYTALGWHREGEPFVEAGIDHIKMLYSPWADPPSGPN